MERWIETSGGPLASIIWTIILNKSAKWGLFVLPIKQGKLFFKFMKFCQFLNINLFFLVSKNGLWAPSGFVYFQCFMFLFICFVLIGKQRKISLTSCFCVRLVLCILMQKTANLWVVPVLRALFFGTPNITISNKKTASKMWSKNSNFNFSAICDLK